MGREMKKSRKNRITIFSIFLCVTIIFLLTNGCPNPMLNAVKQEVEAYQQGTTEETGNVDIPIPLHPSPSDGSAISDATPLLNWEDVGGATGYHLQVSEALDFSSTIVDDNSLPFPNTRLQPPLRTGRPTTGG